MPYDARQIANWFVQRFKNENRPISIMELLKLVYISHGWFLEINARPLFHNRIEAWKFGPVIPDVYNSFRGQGVSINQVVSGFDASVDESTDALLVEVDRVYGSMSAFELSNITHEPGGPWDLASKQYGNYAPIDDSVIFTHYREKRQNAAGSS